MENAEAATDAIKEDEEYEENQNNHDEELPEIRLQLEESYDSNSTASRGKYYKQTYRPAWEQMPDFKGWLRGVPGQPTRAYCTYCQKTLHAHRLSLLKHTCTIRHQKAAQVNSNKRRNRTQEVEQAQIIVHEEETSQGEVETEDGDTMEYVETYSGGEEDEQVDDTEDESSMLTIRKHVQVREVEQNKTPISTHVLDTSRGCPVSGLLVSLYKLIDGRWTYINEGLTNISGGFSDFIEQADFTLGRYKLHYDVDRYFEARKQDTIYPFIEVVFDCRSVTENYHIPIVLSPYGYSTYRGS